MATRDSIQVKSQDERLPYRLRERFMSAPELALFRSLQNMAGKHYVVCPKVALNDIFYIVRPNENVHFFNKIFRKHVDFLLCDPKSLQPVFGIELVKPVGKSEAREADQFLEDLFLSAGLPLVHVMSSENYSEGDLAELFQLAILKVKQTRPLRATGRSDSVPHCPICGKMMVLRMHRTGSDKGKRYYGCMDNPKCSGTVRID
ncbi:MAG: DUF2726 domain-containing protein [Anaerolineales bacterium]|nr:MAG: DUF2726 domain-containing protein [Anaerolineales bacterium]